MDNPFKWRHFTPAIILLTVRWYLRYSLSYRNLEAGQTPAWQMQAQAQPVHEQHHRAGSSVYEEKDQAGFGVLFVPNGLANDSGLRNDAHNQKRAKVGAIGLEPTISRM
jgi:hypothetical protein